MRKYSNVVNDITWAAFQIVAGWRGQQPWRLAVGGGDTAHDQISYDNLKYTLLPAE